MVQILILAIFALGLITLFFRYRSVSVAMLSLSIWLLHAFIGGSLDWIITPSPLVWRFISINPGDSPLAVSNYYFRINWFDWTQTWLGSFFNEALPAAIVIFWALLAYFRNPKQRELLVVALCLIFISFQINCIFANAPIPAGFWADAGIGILFALWLEPNLKNIESWVRIKPPVQSVRKK